jgi:hypothetical protein
MSISYPLAIPTTGIKTIQITQKNITSSNMSAFTGQKQYQTYSGTWLEASVTLTNLNRAGAVEWQAFLAKLQGKKGTFLMGDPDAATPRGTPSGTPLVNGVGQTGVSLITDGWTPSAANVLLEGDYIQIDNHMYMNLTDVTADGSGNATLDIWPRLRADATDGATIITSNCKTIWRLATNNVVWQTDVNGVYTISFTCIEDING